MARKFRQPHPSTYLVPLRLTLDTKVVVEARTPEAAKQNALSGEWLDRFDEGLVDWELGGDPEANE